MIWDDDMNRVWQVLTNRGTVYEELAKESVSSESLYGFLKGFADATEIAAAIVSAQREVSSHKEFEDLCHRISTSTEFDYAYDSDISSDYIENFSKGRNAGGAAAINTLSLMNSKDWTEEGTDEQEDAQ